MDTLLSQYDLLDPHPSIYDLFSHYNQLYFNGALGACTVEWSSAKMTLCAGTCAYNKLGGCVIKLSEPILKFRPSLDLKETLLHEMIHALLFLKKIRDNGDHGTKFQEVMNNINNSTAKDFQKPPQGYHITVYHTMHDEVNNYRTHWWQCQKCLETVKRSMNRPPQQADCNQKQQFKYTEIPINSIPSNPQQAQNIISNGVLKSQNSTPNDTLKQEASNKQNKDSVKTKRVLVEQDCKSGKCWYHTHQRTCGGLYKKIKEPDPKKPIPKDNGNIHLENSKNIKEVNNIQDHYQGQQINGKLDKYFGSPTQNAIRNDNKNKIKYQDLDNYLDIFDEDTNSVIQIPQEAQAQQQLIYEQIQNSNQQLQVDNNQSSIADKPQVQHISKSEKQQSILQQYIKSEQAHKEKRKQSDNFVQIIEDEQTSKRPKIEGKSIKSNQTGKSIQGQEARQSHQKIDILEKETNVNKQKDHLNETDIIDLIDDEQSELELPVIQNQNQNNQSQNRKKIKTEFANNTQQRQRQNIISIKQSCLQAVIFRTQQQIQHLVIDNSSQQEQQYLNNLINQNQ